MTTPPDDPTDRSTTGSDGEDAVDELAQRAGAALRRPAPAQGAQQAMRAGTVIRRRRITVGAAGAAVIALVAVLLVSRGSDHSSIRVDAPSPDTATIVSPTSPTSAAAVPSTIATPPTTVATPTTSAIDRLTQWGLDFVGGTSGPASGPPVRIGLAGRNPAASQAAVDFVNAELGGIKGRPIELDACTWTQPDEATACGTQLSQDPSVPLVISTLDSPEFLDAFGTDKPRFGGTVVNQPGRISYELGSLMSSYRPWQRRSACTCRRGTPRW